MKCPYCTNDDERLLELIPGTPHRILCVVCSKVFIEEKEHAKKEWTQHKSDGEEGRDY